MFKTIKKIKIFGLPLFQIKIRAEKSSILPAKNKIILDKNTLKLAVYNGGGMGDSIIDVAFLQNLKNILPEKSTIDYYAKSARLFETNPALNAVFENTKSLNKDEYDVVLGNHRFFIITKCDAEKVKRLCPKLFEFCQYQKNLRDNILRGNNDNNCLYSMYAELFEKNRWEQLDLKSITGFNRNCQLYMPMQTEAFDVLKRHSLEPKRYISINRGVDSNLSENCPKLWPLNHYKTLLKLLKKKYPDITLVQIGANDKYGVIGADVNLLGKTSIEETKVLLKNALIHIDVEGGLVHLNHILHGKSCVIFGPTPIQPFKYDENINLKSKGCQSYCCWVIADWQKKCLRGFDTPPCMEQTTPKIVFNAIDTFIKNKSECIFEVTTFRNYIFKNKQIAIIGCVDEQVKDKLLKRNIVSFFDCIEKYNLPVQDGMFDVVIDIEECDDFTMAEFLRVLKNDGHLITQHNKIIEYVKREGVKK